MSEYKRLTERDEFGNADIIGVDSMKLQGCLTFEELIISTKALNRLAELEDKIESGKLVEFPRIVETARGIEWAVEYLYKSPFSNGAYVAKIFCGTKQDAEARLKELRGEE